MEYKVLSYTAKSNLHKTNEDNHFICDDYIIVADGMGGESDGDIASRIAVDSIVSVLSNNIAGISSDSDIKDISNRAIYSADSKISEYIDEHPDSFGMGTTVLLAIRKDNMLYISWCGDSHCYAYKDGVIKSITKDHSYVQQLIDSGHITVEESFTHPNNNLITRFVGGGEGTCIPEFCTYKVLDPEIIIFCSDGLSGYCKQNDIAKEIKYNPDIDNLPEQLSDLAVRQGSDDDITIVALVSKAYIPHRAPDSIFGWLKKLVHA